MSLNNSHYGTQGVLLYNGERILIYYDGVEFSIEPDTPQPVMKGNKKGRIYLTSHRVIFVNKNQNDTFQSFSMPFFCMKNLEIEQPVFGANYIKGEVRAEPQGRWNNQAKFKLWFNNGGAIEFGQALLNAGSMASQVRQQQPNYQAPPVYTTSQNIYAAPPPAYASTNYGWIPVDRFPDRPPQDSVYMYDEPPPYSGIFPNPQQQQTPQQGSKVTNVFYNPADPTKVYSASAPPDEEPPAYKEKDDVKSKKD